jgi:hypothetical protein
MTILKVLSGWGYGKLSLKDAVTPAEAGVQEHHNQTELDKPITA